MRLLTRKAILVLPVAFFMAYTGLERGRELGIIDESQTEMMQVVAVENPSGQTILPTYQANGFVASTSQRITVGLSKDQYKTLRTGEYIKVVAIPAKPNAFITVSELEAAKPLIKLGALTVTWEFPFAIFFILILVVYFVLPPTDAI